MFPLRNDMLHAALLSGFAALAGVSASVGAQSAAFPQGAYAGVQLAQASMTLQDIQHELNRLGYDAGPADGLMGARTRWAIQAYQRERGLLEDWQPTAALLSHIRASASGAPSAPVESEAPSQRLVSDTQEALKALGYRVGRVSGQLTDDTRSAIRSYESAHRLLVSGEPSVGLLRHMQARLPSAAAKADADSGMVAQIQAELRLRGYPIPRITGRMDDHTATAIRDYQKGQGVQVTGEPSARLRDELRVASIRPAPVVALSREQRGAAQRALNERGYDAGPADGVLGPRSVDAIRQFQTHRNLDASGELTPRTMELLDLASASAPPAGPDPRQYRRLVRDDFADGNYTHDPVWTIHAGTFAVRNGGLNSMMEPPDESYEGAGQRILGEILGKQFGFGSGGGESPVAAAYLPMPIASIFRITMLVSGSAEPFSHVEFGPFRGNNLNSGHRLVYRPDQPQQLQLVSVDQGAGTEIARATLSASGGAPQRLLWQRDPDGRMIVTHNGNTLIDVVDRGPVADFDGFSMINSGGEWTLRELIVEERR